MNRLKLLYLLCVFIFLPFSPPMVLGADGKSGSAFSQAKFVPDISFILDISANYRNMDDVSYGTMTIPGFMETPEITPSENSAAMNGNLGFNFNYGELALYAAVDPYFELFGVFSITMDGFDIEEGYASTTSLPGGLGIKAGLFLSSFGRLNLQHAHYWDFIDQPLVYRSFFGESGINEPGVQVVWVAPSDVFFQAGGEILQGTNSASFGNESFHDPLYYYRVKKPRGPNLYTAFIKSSFDINRTTVYYGFSGAYGQTRYYQDISSMDLDKIHIDDLTRVAYGIRGITWIAGADLTIKYYIDPYRYVSFQSEYLVRRTTGNYYHAFSLTEVYRVTYERLQSGLYSQVVVKPLKIFRLGARFDLLNINRVKIWNRDTNRPFNLYRVSGMIDFHPSEFTLIRLQYNHDRTLHNRLDHREINHEAILQLNVAIGAHGAHSF